MKTRFIAFLAVFFANISTASADCTSFPIDVFVNGIDPRFNLSLDEANQILQTSINYINQNLGRFVVRQSNNGVPITFEWNDTSVATARVKQLQDELSKLLMQINAIKLQISSANQPENTVNEAKNQLAQLINRYNNGLYSANSIKAQFNNEVLGSFARVSTYALVKIYGYDSQVTLIHVLMHELGHMLGFAHSPGNVMEAASNNSLEYSLADIAKITSEYDAICKP